MKKREAGVQQNPEAGDGKETARRHSGLLAVAGAKAHQFFSPLPTKEAPGKLLFCIRARLIVVPQGPKNDGLLALAHSRRDKTTKFSAASKVVPHRFTTRPDVGINECWRDSAGCASKNLV